MACSSPCNGTGVCTLGVRMTRGSRGGAGPISADLCLRGQPTNSGGYGIAIVSKSQNLEIENRKHEKVRKSQTWKRENGNSKVDTFDRSQSIAFEVQEVLA